MQKLYTASEMRQSAEKKRDNSIRPAFWQGSSTPKSRDLWSRHSVQEAVQKEMPVQWKIVFGMHRYRRYSHENQPKKSGGEPAVQHLSDPSAAGFFRRQAPASWASCQEADPQQKSKAADTGGPGLPAQIYFVIAST